MGLEPQQLHVVFFPFMAHGHMIPTLDIAKLFAARGVRATIISTPLNAPTFSRAIENGRRIGTLGGIEIEVFRFPTAETGLPEGCENLDQAMEPGMFDKFFKAGEILREQLEEYMEKNRPHCLVADMSFPWATDSAAKLNIPRLVFHGISLISLCAIVVVLQYQPYKNVSSDDEPFVIPNLPHKIKVTRTQMPPGLIKDEDTEIKKRSQRVNESEVSSYGVLINSFYDLEPEYAHFYGKEMGRRAWIIGPVSLCNRSIEDKGKRGHQASIDEHDCLKWLNSKRPNSVIYICFGSTAHFIPSQLHEIALALEASGQDFIWVVRKDDAGKSDQWLPPGFEERMQGKGLIIRGWAPQVLILEHEAIGAFVTHCGWNSTLEGVSAGVPMVTWPIFAEQFYNEKLVTDVLKTGIPVGAKKWSTAASEEDIIKRDFIAKALREVMEGEEAQERRNKAKKLKELAWNAVQEGGSSYCELSALINELRSYHALTS